MKILILGASGMLGHVLWNEARSHFEAFGTLRQTPEDTGMPNKDRMILGVDAGRYETVEKALETVRPDVVVNCIGIVKQSPVINDKIETTKVNALFPHLLARSCAPRIRLIHLSTDCVFSGKKSQYTEQDQPDPVDFYGLSKLVGEPAGQHVLVLRTSMFGPELGTRRGLLEWFLSQRGKTVHGFVNAIFSGFYTKSLAKLILNIVAECPHVHGIRNLSSDPISKYELLSKIRNACELPIQLVPDESVHVDRSLDSSLIRRECYLKIPPWEDMIKQLAQDVGSRRESNE